MSESFVSCRQIVIFAQITVTEMEDIIKLHDKKFRIMIPAAKIDEGIEQLAALL